MSESQEQAVNTPNIERANRLASLKANAGYLDLIRLSQEMVNRAISACMNYPGWDAQQIVILKVRMQAAQEHHLALFTRVDNAIQEGIAEAAHLQNGQKPNVADVLDTADYVRKEVLSKFEEMDADIRAAGSYPPGDMQGQREEAGFLTASLVRAVQKAQTVNTKVPQDEAEPVEIPTEN